MPQVSFERPSSPRPLAALLAAALLAAFAAPGCRTRPPAPASAQPSTASPPAARQPTPAPAESAAAAAAPPQGSDVAPVLSPEQALATFRLPAGYRIELVAAEPLVQDPVVVDFDPDGRMYVVEMRGYMPNVRGEGEDRPVGRIVVVEDADDDGRMDRATVFLDSLVLPRAVKVLERGVLVGAPPNLWLVRDTTGDLRADTRELVRDDYGTLQSNPEHNANGLLWGLDNWIHNANYAGEFRPRRDGGGFDFRGAPSVGQWGVSMDEYGRLYRNSNEDPLRADLIPTHYAAAAAAAARDGAGPGRPRGVYEQLTPNVPVWPVRKTPAVNRGYREETLRPDSTLAHYTAAGSPTAYVGDRLPAELRSSVFVTEPAGNLVGRFVVREREEDGALVARRADERTEFVASTDERFRPVNLASAPDGTLYLVDMYRGIIQHRVYITGYLEQKIIERGLEQPIGLGRIYRIVHESTRRGERPRLSRATTAELVGHLTHPNGWWRITAQRLLVERGDSSAAPALRRLLRSAGDDRARLHALWTLDGLGSADRATVEAALADSSPHVRAAALRVAEPRLARPGDPARAAVLRLVADGAPVVRRQLAASLGEMRPASERESVLVRHLARHGADPVVAELAAAALRGRELAALTRLLTPAPGPELAPVLQSLAAGIMRTGDTSAVRRLVTWAGEPGRARWQRVALLAGASSAVGGGGGGGAGRRRGPGTVGGGAPAPLALAARPQGLLATVQGSDSVLSAHARRVAESLTWPGKGAPAQATAARPTLTPAEQQRVVAGRQQYQTACAACHQANGAGMAGVAKSLVGSPWVVGSPGRLIRIVLHGKEGEMLMPPVGGSMTNEQVAAVLTYIRRSWGNEASPIDPVQVREVRGPTMGRRQPWTEAELRRIAQ